MDIRLNKYISDSGLCSRREADKFIEDRRVTLNGKIAEMGSRITSGDSVKVNGRLIRHNIKTVYIVLNKPVGIVSTTDSGESKNIVDYVNYHTRIFNIGRLDKPSEGLILLTNDGNIVNKILRAANNNEKEYEVVVNKPINDEFIREMSEGIPILGTITKKCKITKEGKSKFRIILTQGLNRQIRRMCEFLGYEVVKLKRVRVMNIKLGKLATGQWRLLTEKEITVLTRNLEDSDGGETASTNTGAGSVQRQTRGANTPKSGSNKSQMLDHNQKDEVIEGVSNLFGKSSITVRRNSATKSGSRVELASSTKSKKSPRQESKPSTSKKRNPKTRIKRK